MSSSFFLTKQTYNSVSMKFDFFKPSDSSGSTYVRIHSYRLRKISKPGLVFNWAVSDRAQIGWTHAASSN